MAKWMKVKGKLVIEKSRNAKDVKDIIKKNRNICASCVSCVINKIPLK